MTWSLLTRVRRRNVSPAGVTDRSRELDEVSAKLAEFQDKARELNHSLQRMEDKVASHDALGDAARNPQLLERMKVTDRHCFMRVIVIIIVVCLVSWKTRLVLSCGPDS